VISVAAANLRSHPGDRYPFVWYTAPLIWVEVLFGLGPISGNEEYASEVLR